ncbi:hypothetical protein BGZ49_006252 [Haplosporangium sp. Z 27]|nr:hypothetical protein BGZ49_006252 [Haplosporangium sp. Z 27]
MTTHILIPIPVAADEDTLARELFNETQGPRRGIFLTFDKAKRLIDFHIPGKELSHLSYFKRGYNNRVYLAQCTDASEYIIRLGGRFWDHKKITNERLALQLAQEALEGVTNVPVFIGTSIDEAKVHTEDSTRIIPYDYIIMSRLPGVPIDTVWDEFSQEDKKKIADQIAEIFSRLRSIKLDSIGNFVDGPEGEPVVGPLMEGGGGPFKSWAEFMAGNTLRELNYLMEFKSNLLEILPLVPRIEDLINKIKSGELEQQFGSKELVEGSIIERPISFLHGDLETRNMLVVGTQIVGLHDFEFAGGFPSEHEWCAGLECLFARSEDPYDEGEQQKLRDMTDDQKEIQEYFLKVLQDKYGIRQYGKNNQEYKVILYHLQVNIAPWWLRDDPREQWTEKQTKSLMVAVDSLDQALKFLGC